MQLKELSLVNFKNIAEARLEFVDKVNCLTGLNGMGKSNLLDAIHYLSLCRSFTGAHDRMVVRAGQTFAMARGLYLRRGAEEEITLGIAPGRRKSLRRGGKEYTRLAQHIGLLPLVMVSPSDTDLIRGAAEERRRWMDMVISQADPLYLDALTRYGAALEQRNRMLRDHVQEPALYEFAEMTLDSAAAAIAAARTSWTARLREIFRRHYDAVAGPGEEPALDYRPAWGPSLADTLGRTRRRDEALGHTGAGPHRDDLEMTLCGGAMPVRRCASQGQMKTYALALRLAQHEFLHEATGLRPLLLLDDLFDKLDATRVERMMALVADPEAFGQIFVTDTNRTHIDEIIARTGGGSHRLWSVADGTFTLQRQRP